MGFEPTVTVVSKPFGLPSYFSPPLPEVPPISRRGLPISPHIATLFQFVKRPWTHSTKYVFVLRGRFELPRPFGHQILSLRRLPIPPPKQIVRAIWHGPNMAFCCILSSICQRTCLFCAHILLSQETSLIKKFQWQLLVCAWRHLQEYIMCYQNN